MQCLNIFAGFENPILLIPVSAKNAHLSMLGDGFGVLLLNIVLRWSGFIEHKQSRIIEIVEILDEPAMPSGDGTLVAAAVP